MLYGHGCFCISTTIGCIIKYLVTYFFKYQVAFKDV